MKFQPNSKVILTLSDGSKVRTSENTVISLSLASGVEMTPEILSQLEVMNNYQDCLNKAFDLLSRRPHGTKELRRKLMRSRKFTHSDIDQVMAELENLGYLDDEEFCRLFIEDSFNLKPGDGPAKIRQKLMVKGLDRVLIDQVLSELARDPDDEYEELMTIARKKWLSYPDGLMLQKKKEKLYRFLAGRGFASYLTGRVVREISQNARGD
jgi:regulatory protein